MKIEDERKLRIFVLEIYERRNTEIRISPSWLAIEALAQLDPDRVSPSLVYRAANLELRQIAREICRSKFEDAERENSEQHELFENLQRRYPARHIPGAEPEYILLEHLSAEDVRFNIRRLRAEADAKLAHADALEAWWRNRLAA